MKLILATNQSAAFRDFYSELRGSSAVDFDYSGYQDLLFVFDNQSTQLHNLATGRELADYDGVYINGYLTNYELAAAVAIVCDQRNVGYANHELHNPPSLSKLTMHAKLAAQAVPTPKTLAGTKAALARAETWLADFGFPAILKRADADRGIDNFMVQNAQEVSELLQDQADKSLWIVQQFVPNQGFHLVSFYDGQAAFCIFRSLEERPDGNTQKAHMYKPAGGANAQLIELHNVPTAIIETCQAAVQAMNRQIASVDCLYDEATGKVYVLEVNYNPQLVTITTFKDVRTQALLDYLPKLGQGLAKDDNL